MIQQMAEQNSDVESVVGSQTKSLQGHLMMALPGLRVPDFQEAIILICQNDETGSIGVVINQPINGIHIADVGGRMSDDVDWERLKDSDAIPLFWGGSIEVTRGFMLHSPEISWPTTFSINPHVSITPHGEIFENNRDEEEMWPKHYRMILGHVAWGPGELEKEWMQQEWLLHPYKDQFLFDIDPEQQWSVMMAAYGINPMTLAPMQGRA